MTRKILFFSLFVLFAVAAPVAAGLHLTCQGTALQADGTKPPPPIPDRAGSATAA